MKVGNLYNHNVTILEFLPKLSLKMHGVYVISKPKSNIEDDRITVKEMGTE